MDHLRLENRHTGEILELRRQRRQGELIIELRGTLPARSAGPPLHVHYLEDEEGTVTAGTLSVELDGRRFEAGPGESVRIPHGVSHRWWNAGDQALAFEGRIRPAANLDRYLHAAFEIMNAGAEPAPAVLSGAPRPAAPPHPWRLRHACADSGDPVPRAHRARYAPGALSWNRMARLPGALHRSAHV